jgi:hypothetical protein
MVLLSHSLFDSRVYCVSGRDPADSSLLLLFASCHDDGVAPSYHLLGWIAYSLINCPLLRTFALIYGKLGVFHIFLTFSPLFQWLCRTYCWTKMARTPDMPYEGGDSKVIQQIKTDMYILNQSVLVTNHRFCDQSFELGLRSPRINTDDAGQR